MLRESVKNHYIGMNRDFRYRGEEPTRVEALSDAGFALAIGLLLISTSPPSTFEQLIKFTSDLIPFALCTALIMLIWFEHFKFFIRYGFRNGYIVVLNTLLLFILLFYVYPLKFLARLLMEIYGNMFKQLFGYDTSTLTAFTGINITPQEMPLLMIIYGSGASAIFLILMLMYRYAWKKAGMLGLDRIEIFATREGIYSNLLMAGIPLSSVLLAIVIPQPAVASSLSGFIYLLYVPLVIVFRKRMNKKRKALIESETVI